VGASGDKIYQSQVSSGGWKEFVVEEDFVAASDFPTLQLDGQPVDSGDTINFKTQ